MSGFLLVIDKISRKHYLTFLLIESNIDITENLRCCVVELFPHVLVYQGGKIEGERETAFGNVVQVILTMVNEEKQVQTAPLNSSVESPPQEDELTQVKAQLAETLEV